MYREAKGGIIHIHSFLKEEDRNAARDHMLRTASIPIREAAKIGLQSLYANPEEVFKKYKDFDIVREMQARKGAKLLWVRARAIDADAVNANGDYFSKAELLKDVEVKGEKIPAYKTFEGCPIYTNHKNDDIEQAKGMVVYAEWDEEQNCVYCTFFVDEEAYPDIARNIRTGVIHDVSMGCFPPGTRVLTDKGYMPIENVSQDTVLIDADGQPTKIINRQVKINIDYLVSLDIEGGTHIQSTREHPYLVFTKEQWANRKKRVGKGANRHYAYEQMKPSFVEAKDLKVGDVALFPINGWDNGFSLSAGKARLLGYFAAEGNYLKRNGRRAEIEFSFCMDELGTLVKETVELFRQEFGVEARVYERSAKNIAVVRVTSEDIADWFYTHCGEFSGQKTLSDQLVFSDRETALNLLQAWINGDGGAKNLPNVHHTSVCAWSKSHILLEQMSLIMHRLGIKHSKYAVLNGNTLSFDKGVLQVESKGFDGKAAFFVQIPSGCIDELSKGLSFQVRTAKHKMDSVLEGYICKPIKKIDQVWYEGAVHNFETESNTYIVSGVAVHNCQVESGTCSKCGNVATTEKEYCDCLKRYKGKKHPATGEKVYEKNHGLKFIELSCVSDGAFDTCEIEELYDVDEILDAAMNMERRANSICSSIVLASTLVPENSEERHEFESGLREIAAAAQSAVRLAQAAGTLVGGQLMAGEGADQNATVSAVLNALGIDPSSGLNILDLLNLALNFLEVAVMNLFARKDNVDLTHVGKITKSMADLQNTMQDMIDDGVDTGARNQQPINQGQMQGAGGQMAPQGGGTPLNQGAAQQPINWSPAGNVGRMVGPMAMPAGIGGGVVQASNEPTMLVWASKDGSREVYASTRTASRAGAPSHRLTNNVIEFGQALIGLKDSLGVDTNTLAAIYQSNPNVRAAAGRQTNIKTNAPVLAGAGGNQPMDHFAKIASEQRKKLAAAVSIDFKVEDSSGHRVVLSTDGNISGYVNGVKAEWEPIISENQLQRMENGEGTRVAADLLKEFAQTVKTAGWKPHTDSDVKEVELAKLHKGKESDIKERELESMRTKPAGDKTQQEQLGGDYFSKRRDTDDDVKENLLDEKAGLYHRRVTDTHCDVKEALLEDARKGNPEEVLEKQLECCREEYGPAEAEFVMAAAKEAMGKAVIAARVLPAEIVATASALAQREDFADLIALASLGNTARIVESKRRAFHKIASNLMAPDAALMHALGEAVSKEITAADLAEAVRVAASMAETATEAVTAAAEALRDGVVAEAAPVNVNISREERLKAALASEASDAPFNKNHLKAVISAMVMASEESNATPEEVVASVASLDSKTLTAKINEARTATATEARLTVRARREFWGNQRVASKADVAESTIGWLADYATNFEFPTKSVVEAAAKLAAEPKVAAQLVAKAISAKEQGERTAEITVTEEKCESIRFVCRKEDLGGIDPKDEAFEDTFRQKAIEILSAQGFTVDPGTFSFTDLNVTENGDITASVQTRVTKTFKADGGVDIAAPVVDDAAAVAGKPLPPAVVMSEAAKEARLARRQEVLKRFAQAAPGMGAAPMAPGMDATGMGMSAPEGLGVSALTVPTAAGDNPVKEPADTDAMPEPGKNKPIGTVCPICGSDDVDLANSEGECNSCGTRYKVMQSIEIITIGGDTGGADKPEYMGAPAPDMGLGDDMGLGAATAPAPAAPPAPYMGMSGGMAPGAAPAPGMGAMANVGPAMYRIAATVDADVYLRTAMPDFNREAEKQLPIGMVCPKCGNRHTQKIKNSTICYDCGNYAVSSLKANETDPTKLDVSITWLA
jgi:hypothetical protein